MAKRTLEIKPVKSTIKKEGLVYKDASDADSDLDQGEESEEIQEIVLGVAKRRVVD
jgi:hypothetical protein